MIAALYARVSTLEQKNDMQLTDLRRHSEYMTWKGIEYLEKESAVKKRPVFEQMLEDARAHKFDVIIIWKLDRAFRSLSHLVQTVDMLDGYGIRLICPGQNIDTGDKTPFGKFALHLFGILAQFERDLLIERTKAGVAEARRQGKHCGRPGRVIPLDKVLALRKQGLSWRDIGKKLGIPQATIRRALKKLKPA